MNGRTTMYFMGGGVAANVYSLVAGATLGADAVHITMMDRTHEVPDKTLCVWGKPQTIISDAVVAEWSTLRFGYGSSTIVRSLGDFRYSQYTASSIRSLVDARLSVVRRTGDATEPDTSCDISLDSCFDVREHRASTISLLQHFHGWRVRTPEPAFDPLVATMMDFRVDQSDGVCFVYVLPYSAHEALVECTVFSSATWDRSCYEDRLVAYLRDVIGTLEYEIIDTETGAIPMCDRIPLRERGAAWIAIGAAAGLTKSTTGYTVARCIRDAECMMATYAQTGVFSPPARPAKRFDWYDRLLLKIIRDEPGQVPAILWTLFQRNPVERILRFLDEQTHFGEELLIFWSLPWLPFLRAIVRS